MANSASETTVIGKGTTIKGEMQFEGGARVLGVFEGRIEAGGELQVDQGATCRAELAAARIVVDGDVQGDVKAIDQLTLTANARVRGDITAGTLVVTEGAQFIGHVNIGPEAIKHAQSPRKAAAVVETTPAAQTIIPPVTTATTPARAKASAVETSEADATLVSTGAAKISAS